MGDLTPIAGLTAREAAEILGVAPATVNVMVSRGVIPKQVKHARAGLDRDVIERLALDRPRRSAYWLTATEAAQILQVTPNRVHQLVQQGFLPVVVHNGRSWFRRPQLTVVAHARITRWHTPKPAHDAEAF